METACGAEGSFLPWRSSAESASAREDVVVFKAFHHHHGRLIAVLIPSGVSMRQQYAEDNNSEKSGERQDECEEVLSAPEVVTHALAFVSMAPRGALKKVIVI